MVRSFLFMAVIALATVTWRLAWAIAAPVRLVFAEAFPRPEPALFDRPVIAAASASMPAFVSAYVQRRRARLQSHRRGPWSDWIGAAPSAA